MKRKNILSKEQIEDIWFVDINKGKVYWRICREKVQNKRRINVKYYYIKIAPHMLYIKDENKLDVEKYFIQNK